MKQNLKIILSIGLIAGTAALFQNCAKTESPEIGKTDGGSVQQVDGDISVISKPGDTTFYIGARSFIAVVARSERGLNLSYEWSKEGVKVDGQSSSIFEMASPALTDAGKYKVKIWNDIDVTEIEVNVAVSSSPVPLIRTQPAPITILNGQAGTLEVVAENSDAASPLKYQWLKNGSAIPGANSKTLTKAAWAVTDSGLYTVDVSNTVGVITVVKSNAVGVSVGMVSATVGCSSFAVPAEISKLRVTAIGGGGGGGRSYSYLAYNLLSGAGGAAVEAVVTLPANTASAPYCVGAGGADAGGGASTFMTAITARGGDIGNGWHYKGEDGRGTPPSLGGTFTVDVASAQVIRAANGANVASFGACGGAAGFAADATNTGAGACSSAEVGRNYGGGGWGNGSYYSNGSPTAGAGGYIRIQPAF